MSNNFQFTDLLSDEQIELCELIYDMIKSTYTTRRIRTAISGPQEELDYRKNSALEQSATVDYIMENVEDIHPDDAILICHLMFGIYMMGNVKQPNIPARDAQQIMKDSIVIVLRKYNVKEI